MQVSDLEPLLGLTNLKSLELLNMTVNDDQIEALMMLATLFLVSCVDHGGMMEDMEAMTKDIEDMMGIDPDKDAFVKAVERGDVQAAKERKIL